MPIDYVVQPFPVRKLSTEQPNIDCVFGPFERSVSSVLESYSRDNSEKGRLAFRFFEHLLVTADAKEHREIQIRFLRPDVTPHLDDRVKYIDPVRWFKSKLRLAREQSLHTRSKLEILDLGVGPGHYPAVANYFGHATLGLDLPEQPVEYAREFYDALCQFYKVKQTYAKITRTSPLPALPRRYDLVTAYLVAFSADKSGPWQVSEWEMFLQQLAERVLKPRGDLSMVLAREKITEDVWRWLSERATKFEDAHLRIEFKDLRACLAVLCPGTRPRD